MRDTLTYTQQNERRQRQRTGSRPMSEARELERQWLHGEGNTQHRNFTTESDRANTRSLEEDWKDVNEEILK